MHRASDPSLTDKHQTQEQTRRRLTRRRKTHARATPRVGLTTKVELQEKNPSAEQRNELGDRSHSVTIARARRGARTPNFSIHKRGSQSDKRLDPIPVECEARRPLALLVERLNRLPHSRTQVPSPSPRATPASKPRPTAPQDNRFTCYVVSTLI